MGSLRAGVPLHAGLTGVLALIAGSSPVFAVTGGKTAREIAEQQKIDKLGGIGDLLLNQRNPIGPRRYG